MAVSAYVPLELSKRATDLCEEADKSLQLTQKRYKKDNNRRVRFAPIFLVSDHIFLECPLLSPVLLQNRTHLKRITSYFLESKYVIG